MRDSLEHCQTLRIGFVCIPYNYKMIYLDFQKYVDNLVSHLLECCLLFTSFFNIK